MKRLRWLFLFGFLFPGTWVSVIHPQTPSPNATKSAIPKTWDDAEMAALEIPLANPVGSPKQVPANYYYRVPVRPIYKAIPYMPRVTNQLAIWNLSNKRTRSSTGMTRVMHQRSKQTPTG